MKELEKLKETYESINIPTDYDQFIDEAITKAHKKSFFNKTRIIRLTIASSFCLYVLCLNLIPAFANTMMKLPVIGEISKVLCVKEYNEVSETKDIRIKVPKITNTGNTKLEKRINQEIENRIDQIVKDTRNDAEAIEKEYLNIFRESKSFTPANVNIDYKVYFQSNETLSFVINKTVILANNHTEKIVYNLNLESGQDLTLHSLLGDDYKNIVNTQINRQIEERIKTDKNAYFYDNANKFKSISEQQKFYINTNGQIVIIFEKYEIAPGYMGTLEFTLDNKVN